MRDKTFKFTFSGKAPLASTAYTLVAGADPYYGGRTLGTGLSDAMGDISIDGDIDFDADLVNNKVWLVLSSHWTGGGSAMSGWNASAYLFETSLMDYYDADRH